MLTYRAKIRSLMLIHSLFKGIFSFELALRFASSLANQEASVGPEILYSREFLKNKHSRNIKRKRKPLPNSPASETVSLQTADMAKCDSSKEMT